MPLRGGESVGQAYVRIYGDGSSMPSDIRRALDDAEPSVREAGRRHADAYEEGFLNAETRKSFKTKFGKTQTEMFHDMEEGWADAIERIDLADKFFHGPKWIKFQKQVEKDFPDEMAFAARLAMKKIEAEFRDSGDLEALPRRLDRIGIDVRRAQSDILDAYAEQDRQRSQALKLQERDLIRSTATFKNSMKDVAEQVSRLERGLPSEKRSHLHAMLEDLRRLAPTIAENDDELIKFNRHIDDTNRSLNRAHPTLSRWHHSMDTFGSSIGRLFGKGSRNNFLNFLGSVVGGLIKFPTTILFKAAEGVTKFGQSIVESFVKKGGGFAGTLAGLGTGLGQVAVLGLKAMAGIAAFGAILLLLSFIIGPIVAILSGLVGILAALASTLAFASASLLAFLPLIIPLAAIIAGVVAAVMDLKGAGGELGKTMDEISDKATSLWDRFKTGVGDSKGLSRVLHEVNRALGDMKPLVDAVIKGFNRFADQIAKEMQGGAFDKFTDRFARFLPHAMKDLGTILGNALGGVAGVFTGLIPSANRLLDWLVRITDRFDKWANSKKGQREIKKFMEDAADSAESLGGFLEDVWGFLKKILGSGKDTGDSIFEDMGKDFRKWTKWLEDHPDALTDWFKHADEIAEDLGDIVESMGELIDDLDDADSRESGSKFLKSLADALALINGLTDTAQLVIHLMTRPSEAGGDLGDLFGFDWDKFMTKVQAGIHGFIMGIGSRIKFLWDKYAPDIDLNPNLDLGGFMQGLGVLRRQVRQAVSGAIGEFRGMAGRVASAAGDIAGRVMARLSSLRERVLGVVNEAVARFGNFGERVSRAIGDLWAQISSKFTSVVTSVEGIVGRIVGAFIGLAAKILAAIGPVVIHVGIEMPHIPGTAAKKASGGIVSGAQLAIIGEEGAEAVVPLNRPLSQVDPSVRWLSAIAQGRPLPAMGAGGVAGGQTVDLSGWQIITPSRDPRIVAVEVVNELIARVV